MSSYSIEEIHEWLDGLEPELEDLRSYAPKTPEKTVRLADYPVLCSIFIALHWDEEDWQTGISKALINKLRKGEGRLQIRTILPVAERVRTFLRSEDQRFAERASADPETQEPAEPTVIHNQIASLNAERWIYIEHRKEIKAKLLEISQSIEDVIRLAENPNLPPDMAALTNLERAQFIALLETALTMVKSSPMIETGLLKRIKDKSKKIAAKTVEKKAEEGLGIGLDALYQYLAELLSRLLN